MYSYGRDFDDRMDVTGIFGEYIDGKRDEGLTDGAFEALSGDGLETQRRVFEAVSLRLMPFVSAAVNGIEAAGLLDIENASDKRLIDAAASDACDAALGFYGQFEEYRDLMRAFGSRRFLLEKICSEMTAVEFLNRINCV